MLLSRVRVEEKLLLEELERRGVATKVIDDRELVFALENGYYQVPKKVTTEEIASKLKLPRTTYEEHLRKAEGKVLRSMAPYISLSPARPLHRGGV